MSTSTAMRRLSQQAARLFARSMSTGTSTTRAYSQTLISTSRLQRPTSSFQSSTHQTRQFASTPFRCASSPTTTEAMEQIEQLYENASEEFQIAAEETEGNTVYASDDRDAARAEVTKLEDFYKSVVEGTGYDAEVREEVRRRAGQRVRELANAMKALEEKAMEHD